MYHEAESFQKGLIYPAVVQQPPGNQPGPWPPFPPLGRPAQPHPASPPPKDQGGLVVAFVLLAAPILIALAGGVAYVVVTRSRNSTDASHAHGNAFGSTTPTRIHDPRVRVTVLHDDYKIMGSTAAALRQQMNQDGPAEHERHYDAHTDWNVKWSYPFDRSGGRCATGPVTVTLTITYRFPEWDADSDAPPSLVEKWHTYMQALQMHEDGHAEHGREAADEVIAALAALPPADACPAMDGMANTTGRAITDRYAAEDVTYDRETNHGATQGARFP